MDSLRPTRREMFGLPALLVPLFATRKAFAGYGGDISLSLPFAFDAIDPNDPFDVVAALIGDTLFEPLYRRQGENVYPTLADGLPTEERGRVLVRLRPKMSFSSGAILDAAAVRKSIEAASEKLRGFLALPEVRVKDPTTLEFGSGASADAIAKILAEPLLAIRRVGSSSNDGTGPLRIESLERGRAVFVRNSRCPRGGSFLDRVTVTSAPLDTCLRDFELGKSSIGYQGLGLHHDRKDARPFRLLDLGLLVVTGIEKRTRFSQPGALEAALAATDRERLGALGVVRAAGAPAATRVEEPLGHEAHPLFRSVAETLGTDLGFSPHEFGSIFAHRSVLGKRDGGANLVFVRAPENRSLAQKFYQRALSYLDGSPGASSLDESPEKLARRLRLGLVGRFSPSGGVAPSLRTPEGSPFDLGNSTVDTPARRI